MTLNCCGVVIQKKTDAALKQRRCGKLCNVEPSRLSHICFTPATFRQFGNNLSSLFSSSALSVSATLGPPSHAAKAVSGRHGCGGSGNVTISSSNWIWFRVLGYDCVVQNWIRHPSPSHKSHVVFSNPSHESQAIKLVHYWPADRYYVTSTHVTTVTSPCWLPGYAADRSGHALTSCSGGAPDSVSKSSVSRLDPGSPNCTKSRDTSSRSLFMSTWTASANLISTP